MPNTEQLVLLGIALLQAFTAIVAYLTNRTARAAAANIQKVEVATNSMKDALVAATGKAADAMGFERGRLQGELTAERVAGVTAPVPVADARAAAGIEKIAEVIKDASKKE